MGKPIPSQESVVEETKATAPPSAKILKTTSSGVRKVYSTPKMTFVGMLCPVESILLYYGVDVFTCYQFTLAAWHEMVSCLPNLLILLYCFTYNTKKGSVALYI